MSGNDANTLYITRVVGDVTISPKSDVPSFQKKVKDTNDTTGDTTGWQDSADYDIGDKVPFQLKATLPSNYARLQDLLPRLPRYGGDGPVLQR